MTLLSTLGIGGRAAKPTPTVLTGATGELVASHRDRKTSVIHQHAWTITVWVEGENNALAIREALDSWISRYSGKILPDRIAWAEDMAAEIAACLTDHSGYHGYIGTVTEVHIQRPFERLSATWRLK